jgi:hypothetical protein
MPYWEAGKLGPFFRRYHFSAFLACIVIYGIARLTLQVFAPTLLPHAFVRSQQVILILLPGAIAGFLIFPLTIPFLMFLRPRFLFAMDALALPFLLIAYRFAIPAHGITGAAWVTSSYGCLKAAVALTLAWRWVREGDLPQLRVANDVLPPFEVFEGGSIQ